MRNILLLATGGLIIAALVKNIKSFSDNLQVYVGIGGLPKFKGFTDVYLPVKIRIDNPEKASFKVTELFLTIYKAIPGQEPSYLASTTPLRDPFTIKSTGTTEFIVDVRIPTQNILIEGFSAYKQGFAADNYPLKGYLKADGFKIDIDTTTQNQKL